MTSSQRLTQQEKNLIRRYLIWCYKTTKEDVDRIDRYFTQWLVDQHLLKDLNSSKKKASCVKDYGKLIGDFEAYMHTKRANAQKKKILNSSSQKLQPQYEYLKNRLSAVEKAICHFFNKKELTRIRNLYEGEMTRRILEAREHT